MQYIVQKRAENKYGSPEAEYSTPCREVTGSVLIRFACVFRLKY